MEPLPAVTTGFCAFLLTRSPAAVLLLPPREQRLCPHQSGEEVAWEVAGEKLRSGLSTVAIEDAEERQRLRLAAARLPGDARREKERILSDAPATRARIPAGAR